jgi:hypothetical protein
MTYFGYTLLPTLLFFLGCQVGVPDQAVVAKIERRLEKDVCLHSLNGLRRTYRFARRGWEVDTNRIDIEITQAGYGGLPAGRFSLEPKAQAVVDDNPFFGAWATYVISGDKLDLWACGVNMTPGALRHQPMY